MVGKHKFQHCAASENKEFLNNHIQKLLPQPQMAQAEGSVIRECKKVETEKVD